MYNISSIPVLRYLFPVNHLKNSVNSKEKTEYLNHYYYERMKSIFIAAVSAGITAALLIKKQTRFLWIGSATGFVLPLAFIRPNDPDNLFYKAYRALRNDEDAASCIKQGASLDKVHKYEGVYSEYRECGIAEFAIRKGNMATLNYLASIGYDFGKPCGKMNAIFAMQNAPSKEVADWLVNHGVNSVQSYSISMLHDLIKMQLEDLFLMIKNLDDIEKKDDLDEQKALEFKHAKKIIDKAELIQSFIKDKSHFRYPKPFPFEEGLEKVQEKLSHIGGSNLERILEPLRYILEHVT